MDTSAALCTALCFRICRSQPWRGTATWSNRLAALACCSCGVSCLWCVTSCSRWHIRCFVLVSSSDSALPSHELVFFFAGCGGPACAGPCVPRCETRKRCDCRLQVQPRLAPLVSHRPRDNDGRGGRPARRTRLPADVRATRHRAQRRDTRAADMFMGSMFAMTLFDFDPHTAVYRPCERMYETVMCYPSMAWYCEMFGQNG